MNTQKDFWGDLQSTDNIILPYPYSSLKEQGELLSKKTNGLLIGELIINNSPTSIVNSVLEITQITQKSLTSPKTYPQPKFYYLFRIRVPSLNNYTYYVLEVQYPVNIYPVYIWDLTIEESYSQKCDNQEQFDQIIESILGSNTVKQTIFVLLEQLKENRSKV